MSEELEKPAHPRLSLKARILKIFTNAFVFLFIGIWLFSGVYQPTNSPFTVQQAQATVETFTTAVVGATWTAPAGVSSVDVECWGAGGAGGGDTSDNTVAGSGGGGGAYAAKTIAVTPLAGYSYTVGDGVAGGTGNGTAGTDSSFTGDASVQCVADGGLGGGANGGTAGAGGTLANSDGTTEFAGGAGFTSVTTTGGGGGGSGGTGATGNSATNGTGATAVTGGGPGGNGEADGSNGSAPASGPGGAGGGSGNRSGGSESGGAGFDGQLRLTYTVVTITVSGTLYDEDGATALDCSISNRTVAVSVNGAAPAAATCTAAGGTYSVPGAVVAAGNVVTTFIDGHADDAATVTRAANGTSNITGLDLYKNTVIVRHEDSTATTNGNLGQYDKDNEAGDIPFTSNNNELKLNSDTKLIIWYDDTFDPGGNIITATSTTASQIDGDVQVNSNATLKMDADQLWVGGDFTSTTTLATLTLTSGQDTFFTATSTLFSITPTGENFEDLIFSGSGGSWSNSATMTINGDLTMTAGTLNGTGSVTVNGGDVTGGGTISKTGGTFTVDGAGNFDNNSTAWTFSSLTFGDGSGAATTTALGTGGVTVSGTLTTANNQGLKAAGKTWTLSGAGTPFTNSGNWFSASSTVAYTSASGVSALSSRAMTNGYSYNNLTINSSGDTFTAGVAVTASSTLEVTAGSFILGTNNLTVGSTESANTGSIKVASGQTLNQAAGGTTTILSASGSNCIGSNGASCAGTAGTLVFGELTIGNASKTFTTTFGANAGTPTTTVDGVFTVTTNATFDGGAQSGTMTLAGSGTPFVRNGTFTANTMDVNYIGTSATNVTGATYDGLGLGTTSDGGTGVTYTLAANATTSALTIGNTGSTNSDTLDAASRTLTLSGASQPLAVTSKGIFEAGTSNVRYTSGSGAPSLSTSDMTGSNAYYNLEINGTGTFNANVAVVVENALSVLDGILSMGVNALTVGSTGVTNSGSIKVASGDTLNQSSDGSTTILSSASGSNCIGATGASCAGTAGTLVFGGLTIGDGSTTFTTTFGGTSPSTTVDGIFRIRESATFAAGSGTVNLKGPSGVSFLKNGTLTANTSTFIYFTVDSLSMATTTYYNLSLTPTSTATIVLSSNALDVDNNLTIGDGTIAVTVNADTNDPTVDIDGNLTISTGSTFVASASGAFTLGGNFANSGAFTHSNGTVILDAADSGNTISTGGNTFYNLTFNNSAGVWSASSVISATSSVTITGGALNMGTNNLVVGSTAVANSGSIKVASGQTLNQAAGGTTTIVSSASGSNCIGSNGASCAGTAGTLVFGGLTIGDGATTFTTTFGGTTPTTTVDGVLNITASATFNAGTGSTLRMTSSGTPFTRSGTFTAGTATTTFESITGTTAISSAAMTGSNAFYNLKINGTGNFTGGVAVEATNELKVRSGSLLMGANALTVGSTSVTNSGSIKVATGQTLNQSSGGTTTILGSASGSNCIGSNGASCAGTAGTLVFGGLTIGDGSTTFTTTFGGTSPSTTVDGVFRIRDNTTFVAGSGTVNLKGVTGASFLKTGTFTPNTSTFIYHGVDAISVATTTFYNLSLTPTGTATYVLASGTYSIDNDLTIGNGTIAATLNADTNDPTIDVNRDLVISANSFFTASSAGTLTVARNWSKSGTFTHSSGTVIFDTTTTSVITGATTFNHFTSTTAGKTLQFGNGTIFTFAGTFTITGTGSGSNRVTVNSNSAGNQWTAQFNSAQSAVTYADIKDCGCNGGTANVTLDSTSKNSGNNGSCWVFPVVSTGATGATGTGSGGGTPQGGGGTGAGGGTGGGSGGGIPQGGGGTGGGGGSTP